MKFYSKITHGFYDNEIHENLPKDAISIADELYDSLLIGQSMGKKITSDDSEQPILTDPSITPPRPNLTKFIQDIKIGVGGIINANGLATAYPLFFSAIQLAEWFDVELLITDAFDNAIINTEQFNAIKSAAVENNIPIYLS